MFIIQQILTIISFYDEKIGAVNIKLFLVICIVIFGVQIGVIFWNHIFTEIINILFAYIYVPHLKHTKVIFTFGVFLIIIVGVTICTFFVLIS